MNFLSLDKLKVIAIGILLGSTLLLGWLYNSSLKEIANLKVELKNSEDEKNKIIDETNEYKSRTDELLAKYSEDTLKWQDKVAEARSDCDKRLELYRNAESEVLEIVNEQNKSPNQKTIINDKTSNAYIKELNERMKNAKFPNTSNTK